MHFLSSVSRRSPIRAREWKKSSPWRSFPPPGATRLLNEPWPFLLNIAAITENQFIIPSWCRTPASGKRSVGPLWVASWKWENIQEPFEYLIDARLIPFDFSLFSHFLFFFLLAVGMHVWRGRGSVREHSVWRLMMFVWLCPADCSDGRGEGLHNRYALCTTNLFYMYAVCSQALLFLFFFAGGAVV